MTSTSQAIPTLSDPFPFRRVASLQKLIEFWQKRAAEDTGSHAVIAREVLSRLEEAPELMAAEVTLEDLKSHPELVDLLMIAVFPSARRDNVIASAFLPFDLRSFYETPPFSRLKILEKFLTKSRLHGCEANTEEMMRGKAMNAYHKIVSHFYKFEIDHEIPFVVELPEQRTGLNQYYRILIDPAFVTLKTNGPLPDLHEENRRRLLAEPVNLELWMQILPPEHFEFHGFVVMTAVDVTQQEVLSKLKNDLLVKEAMTGDENLERLERHLRELLFRPDLKLGLIALDRCREGCVTGARSIGRSLLLQEALPVCDNWKDSYYAEVIRSGEMIFIDDLAEADKRTGFEKHLMDLGYRNLFLAPLRNREEVVGVLELASPNCCDLTAMQSTQLHEVSTLFATAINRSLEEQEDRVQAIIKKQYTAIHPVVEWRFREAALNKLISDKGDELPEVESIAFSDVHPLYGMSDIRGSSEFRAEAIRADLTEQLGLALAVIIAASAVRPRPSLDELGYRLSRYIEELVAGTRSGDERSLVLFLQTEIEPLFERMKSYSEDVAEKIEMYRDAVDSSLGVIYRKRKAFEDSVSILNDTISAFLDRKEEEAQGMIPHYFEKYKTDGVEYNIYAGSSLLENGQFDDLDLTNLKLWQLTTMAGVVWEMKRLKPDLEVSLDTAHLILVQSIPLAIRFRIDEKKFDVDGAYNIRYEIVKKRIDKVRVAETAERLTQPGKIAIVYSHESEAEEYQRYLDYLQAAGYLEPGVEHLELEKLQGVQGLKALRVTVADQSPAADPDLVMPSETVSRQAASLGIEETARET